MNTAPLVIVCTCHDTLCPVLPERALVEGMAVRRPEARLKFFPSLCRPSDLKSLSALIEQERPSALLLAACSPFAKGRNILDELIRGECAIPVDLIDIREGCSFIHAGDSDAPDKAVDLICMGLAGLIHRQRSPKVSFQPQRRALVVGAGPAGLAAAGILARLGIPVTLADRMGRAGGLLNQIGKLFPANTPSRELLDPLLQEIDNPMVDFLSKTSVARIEGDPGSFTAHLVRDGQESIVQAGAVILACGALPVLPDKDFRSGEVAGVISQLELETRLRKLETQEAGTPEFKNAVFIQCMAARDEAHPYCSTVCCPTALKNALRLKSLNREVNVTVVHRGIMAPGRAMEELYRKAMTAGVRFVAYSPADPPEVRGDGKVSAVSLKDALSGRDTLLPADLVVLSTPLKPRPETSVLTKGLGVRLDEMAFARGREPMHPLATPVPGVYLCGTVRWPVYAEQAVDQGRAAGVKTAAFLAGGSIGDLCPASPPGPAKAAVRTDACSRCGQCVAVCPYGASRRDEDGAVSVSAIRCHGCGLCTAVCPSGAARIPEHNVAIREILREIAPRIAP